MICFYFPAKGVGGLQSIIINITEQLSKLGYCVKVICYEDSVTVRELRNRKVSFRFIDFLVLNQLNCRQYVDKNDTVVFFEPFMNWDFFYKANPKIFFWSYPKIFDHLNIIIRFQILFVTKRLIQVLIKKNAVAFMDRASSEQIKSKIGVIIKEPKFLPIPVKDVENNVYLNKQARIKKNKFHVTYMGRGIYWKYYPCLRIIQDLCAIQIDNVRIKFHILTDDIDFYKSRVLKDVKEMASLEVRYHRDVYGSRLDEFLIQNSDLNISMGTSCIEGSKLGIPSLLIDASCEEISNSYKYRWIFESIDYCLGYIWDNKKGTYPQGERLATIINDLIFSERFRKQISSQCFSYTMDNHSLCLVTDRFLKLTQSTEARVLNVSKYCIGISKVLNLLSKFIAFFAKIFRCIRHSCST